MTNGEATILGAFIGGSFSLIGAVIGAFFIVKFQSRRNVEQAFSDSVHEILTGMYPEAINWPKNSWRVLYDKMPEMHQAISKLKFHLSPVEITRIDAAWVKYKKWCNQIHDGEITARPMYQETSPSVDQIAVFKRHVDVLLSYSKKV